MRLCRLDLGRFGPFTDARLDFGDAPGRLEIVFGPNEAGKSTALRAISALLFGIPERTEDAHVHRGKDLRLGGRLIRSDGGLLEFERLKKRKGSLVAPDGSLVEEAVLQRFLGGVTEKIFTSMFGLDQHSLRKEAKAALDGKGDVGQSLFDAGLGGAGVRHVLEALEREALALYNPSARAEKPSVNQAIAALREARERKLALVTTPQSYFDQQSKLDALQAELDALDAERSELSRERARLALAATAVPLLAQRQRLLDERGTLGPCSILPEGARARRLAAEDELKRIGFDLAHHQGALEQHRAQRAALVISDALLSLGPDVASELRDRVGSQRKAEKDLPGRRAELTSLEDEARILAERLGPVAEKLSRERVPDVERARIDRLGRERGRLETVLVEAEATCMRAHHAVERLRSKLGELPEAPTLAPLERAILAAERARAIDSELEQAGLDVQRLRASSSAGIAALGLADPSAGARLPSPEAVARFEKRFAALERKAEQLAKDTEQNQKRSAGAEQTLDRLRRAGSVPTESALSAAREERDRAWHLVRAAWLDGDAARSVGERSLPDFFEASVAEADDVADRLRREAGRVAELGAAEAERVAASLAGEQLGRAREDLETALRALETEWLGAWSEAGVVPALPAEMSGWLTRHAAVESGFRELEDVEARLARLGAQESELRARLAAALESVGTPLSAGDGCAVLLALAIGERDRAREVERTRVQLAEALADAERDLAEAERRRDACGTELEGRQRDWAAALAPLGLRADTTPDEAATFLRTLADLETKRDLVGNKARSVRGMERDGRALEVEVAELVVKHAPELSGLPTAEAAERLIDASHRARAAANRARDLDEQIAETERVLIELASVRARVDTELAALVRQAGVESPAQLERAEKRSEELARIAAALTSVEEKLAELQEGRSLEELAANVAGVDPHKALLRLEDINVERDELGEKRDGLRSQVSGARAWLEDRVGTVAAVEAEAAVQRRSAEIHTGIERWARLELARAILEREVERYRERNQGPVLSRANELFEVLTRGEWLAIRPDVDASGSASLACVRADGERVPLTGLSGGTQDPLYLALRLSSLEHHAASSEPLPLVLDDVLSELDEPRVSAALTALSSVAARLQILLFTHHARHVELARKVVAADRLSVVELPRREVATEPSASSASSGPTGGRCARPR